MNWEEYINQTGSLMEWPYPIRYDVVNQVDVDVLVLGGGPAGCMAAISAARKGLKVALVDKTNPKRGGGHGFDHWLETPNPCSKITPEECCEYLKVSFGGYANLISRYITVREGYDTLLEIEKMGAKIRDTDDEFKSAPFRDEETKFLFCYDYESKLYFRAWGTTYKPAMYKECKRLGVQIFDFTMATSLLNEKGRPGVRVVGATGFNVRTGEFYVFRAKATVNCMSRHSSQWRFSTELTGLNQHRANVTGDGTVMAWRAGAVLTNLEKNRPGIGVPGYAYPSYGVGTQANTWHPATIVDANGKEIPWVDYQGRPLTTIEERTRPAPGQKYMAQIAYTGPLGTACPYALPSLPRDLNERILKGEFTLPLYADLTDMPWYERKAIWGLMVGQEGKTRIPILSNYQESGFDSSKDMLQSYQMLTGSMDRYSPFQNDSMPYFGAIVVDWDLKTTLDGLYCAGDAIFASNDYNNACVTGRYAGRKAAEYALKASDPVIDRGQIDGEKARVYSPLTRETGIEWKELRAVGARLIQNYCGGIKNEELLKIGLKWAEDLEENVFPEVYAGNPHVLMRVLETFNMVICDQLIIQASLSRKASSRYLGFTRQDYPAVDPPDWRKWLTIQQVDGDIKRGELPIDFWGSLVDNYEAHNKDYVGYFKQK
jgi:succinate dehydrogenase/fumarate reductase flavoprotein subunit